MKIYSLGDVHGRDIWFYKDYSKFDKVIFIGDYVDNIEIKDSKIIENLENIIQFKKDNIDKVILLWGNHDIQYIGKDQCSGFNSRIYKNLNKLFIENKNLFQLSYQIKNYLWIHAGIHSGWWNLWIRDKKKIKKGENVADTLNRLFIEDYDPIFHCGVYRGGPDRVGGPLWLDKRELMKPLKNYHQIVGHNRLKDRKIKHISQNFKGETSITLIDTENNENYELEL